ncbi:RluA family pseudouridine synthase [Sporosarcina sp. Te-1]|uniref:RluA family pseudouridine synthase n=1 Tax=Sporosarcina sp. Te-1 TaxID=2818390 RepID=UPI001A9E5785|nr:RluA family pseudouridine synthase [Sporosarcina sp. Te-1]QTD41293.1 RluA family pseudouridine synthase [Sporosarcina sp. Te-1]
MRKKGPRGAQSSSPHTSIFQVKEEQELLPFLLEVLTSSRNSVKSILTRGQASVDGVVVTRHDHQLQPGQRVEIVKNKAAKGESELEGISILFEDEDLLVIDKEAGLLSVAAKDKKEMTAFSQAASYVRKMDPKSRIFIVHRLDRDTSGVLVFAKNEAIKQQLQNNWNELVRRREYTALVEGKMKKDEGTIKSWLKETKTFKIYSSPVDNGGQLAITHYRKIRSNQQFSLLEVLLDTGRKNQIRVHMEDIGHPIVGDRKYGSSINPIKRLGLHASAVEVIHPKTGELMRFESDVPEVFYRKCK